MTTKVTLQYDEQDGLQGNRFIANSAHMDTTGRMFFGGINGVTHFMPDSISTTETNPSLLFTQLSLYGTPVTTEEEDSPLQKHINATDHLSLDYTQNMFALHFVAVDFQNQEKLTYRYRLIGFDKQWQTCKHGLFAHYMNLPAGEHVLEVEAFLSEYSKTVRQISVSILPPWWKTWWFKLLSVVIACILLFGIYVLRVRSLNRQKKALEATVQERTAELREQTERLTSKNVELLRQHEVDGVIHSVHDSSTKIYTLLENLLTWAQSHSEQLSVKIELIELTNIVKQVIDHYNILAKEKAITISFAPTEKVYIKADLHMMHTIIRNAIGNAIKFTKRNGFITIKTLTENNSATVSIADTGIGIPKDILPSLLDNVHNSPRTGTNGEKGTGIGLATSKELAGYINADIQIESEEGKGTTFYCSIPYEKTAQIETINQNIEESVPVLTKVENENDLKRQKEVILIIDDDKNLRNYITTALEKQYTVFEASDGKEGIEQAKQIVPDIIISDVTMPEMDGFALASELKNDDLTSHIPLIFLSALKSVDSKLSGYKLGAIDFINKPVDVAVLTHKISNTLHEIDSIKKQALKQFTLKSEAIKEQPSRDAVFIETAKQFVEKNLDNPDLGVNDLASAVCLSRTQLFRKTKGLLGVGPLEFIQKLRLSNAKHLLETSHHSITEVAYMVGFNNSNYFSKCFLKEFGIRPSVITKARSKEKV